MKEYLQQLEEVMQAQQSGNQGLAPGEIAGRLAKHGHNELAKAPPKSLISRIWDQIKDPMVLILLGAAIVSGAFGEIADMVIIMIVVVVNAALGIFQENKAEQAIEALQKMSAPHTRVRRGGSVTVIESRDIVPGDIILLEAGDSIPADMRLIEAASLKIEEAALTGESVPVEKDCAALNAAESEIPLGDRINMAYMGTNVSYGRGEGVVTATGMNTEMGAIADILANTEDDKTPLQQKLAGLSKVLSIAVLVVCVVIFGLITMQDGGFELDHVFEALLIAVSLAVAAIPEGLVVVVTVLLSIGVTRMSGRNAIIRRLTAVETLGCTQVICSDKTGTLTQNKMTVVDHYGNENMLASAMFMCNDTQTDTQGNPIGDPTEIALWEYARKQELKIPSVPRVAEAPFDSVRKMMSTIHTTADGKVMQFSKGAPDEILRGCTHAYVDGEAVPMTEEIRQKILAENKRMAASALRVLAGACREHSEKPSVASPELLEQGMTFIGLAGMIDPVRPEVQSAIEECDKAGIRAIMITGDHRDTAMAIAKDMGILDNDNQAITGAELSDMSDDEFERRIEGISVYARVQPEHKMRIVRTWKKKGVITAMTGDGVNDAPALKVADIGVGMGITGTDVTKNVADMVLSDDNFASIIHAVEEGRRIYENIRKVIQFLLSTNLAEVLGVLIATLIGFKLFEPIHVLWVNLVTDCFPALALGMEASERNSMSQPPRDPKQSIFSGGVGVNIIYQGAVIAGLTLLGYYVGSQVNAETGMTMAFLTLCMCEICQAITMRSRTQFVFTMKSHNKYLLGAMILSFVLIVGVIVIPGVNDAFSLVKLSMNQFCIAFGLGFLIIPIIEIVKAIQRLAGR